MLFGLLFLSLVPVAFLADGFDDVDDDGEEQDGNGFEEVPITGEGDFIKDHSFGPEKESIEEPQPLQPNTGLGDGETLHLDSTLLDQLIGSETDHHYGREDFGNFIGAQDEMILSDLDDELMMESVGSDEDAPGEIDTFRGTPVLQSGNDELVDVVDAGAGDDIIQVDDNAAYVFGNGGEDDIVAGEGVIAAFGGEGDDLLDGRDSAASFLDGGKGDDILLGGDGDDILFGGEHEFLPVDEPDADDRDVIKGGAGNDRIAGGLGSDFLSGGGGSDQIDHFGHAMETSGAERHDYNWHDDGAADVLDGEAGDDTLIFGNGDIATGGSGEDVFWLYSDGQSGADQAEITDFVVGEDFLRVSLDPEMDRPDIEYDVQPSSDGRDGLVTINGKVIAVLKGTPNASIHDVFVEIRPDIFT